MTVLTFSRVIKFAKRDSQRKNGRKTIIEKPKERGEN